MMVIMAMIMRNSTEKQEDLSRNANQVRRGEKKAAVPTYKIYKKGEFG